MSSEKFGDLLNYRGSHIRNIERGSSGYKALVSHCEVVMGKCEEPIAGALADLVRDLRAMEADTSMVIDRHRGTERKIEARRAAPLVGQWSARWQTSRNGVEVVVLETVVITVSGQGWAFKMTNLEDSRWLATEDHERGEAATPDQFIDWSASCRMTKDEQWIHGDFTSVSGPRVDGMFRLQVNSFKDTISGEWVGPSWDSEWTFGLLVLARDEELADARFAQARSKAPDLPRVRS